jgi:hypothetical protein
LLLRRHANETPHRGYQNQATVFNSLYPLNRGSSNHRQATKVSFWLMHGELKN